MDGCFNGVGFKVVSLPLPGIETCRAIPLEQLTKCASFRNCSKGMELRLGLSVFERSSKGVMEVSKVFQGYMGNRLEEVDAH